MSITRRSTSLTTKLKEYALKHSIDLIGVTSAKSFEVDGWAGPIVNPRSYLKNARSVVVFGYYQLDKQLTETSKTAQPRGRLIPGSKAFFSMDEYCSEVITKYLKEKGHNAVRRRLMDKISLKALAVKAGLGMYGKNSIVLELMDIPTVRRNAALALGNTGNSAAVPALAQSLSDPDSKLRLYAAWALGKIGGKQAHVALTSSLCDEVDEEVKEEMRAALKIERG